MSRYDEFREIFTHVTPLDKLWFLRWESKRLLGEIHDYRVRMQKRAEEKQFPGLADDFENWGNKITDISEELQDLIDALTDWKPRSSLERDWARDDGEEEPLEPANSETLIPGEIRSLIDETVELVRAHPKHEMGQDRRRKIYEALWANPQGEMASKWLAIIAARRVQSIYERTVAMNSLYNTEFVVCLPHRMLTVAEKVTTGILTVDDIVKSEASGEIEDFYQNLPIISGDQFPPYVGLALMAAYYAMAEAEGSRPLQNRISGQVRDEQGNVTFTASDTWTDDRLAGSGCHADDAAVNAAYAFAQRTARGKYDIDKLLEFWEWWLKEAILQAWQKAEDTRAVKKSRGAG